MCRRANERNGRASRRLWSLCADFDIWSRLMQVEHVGEIRARSLRSASRSLGEFLDRDARAVELLQADGPLPDRMGYFEIMSSACASGGMSELRLERRRRLVEIAGRDLAAEASLEEVCAALTDLADACLDAALKEVDAPPGLAIIGMGKLGGRELNYSSDIDVMFVTDGDLGAATVEAT